MQDAGDRCRFVARLSVLSKLGALAGILEYEEALSAVARLAIPELADWCIVDVVEDGETRRVHVAHRDSSRLPLAEALRAFPLDHAARRDLPAARAARSGRPVIVPEWSDELLGDEPGGEYQQLIRALRVRSLLVVPVSLSTSLATMAFVMTSESGRRYAEDDVAVAEELVQRAAQCVENARMHRKLQQTEQRFRVALAHSNITVFEQDADGRFRWIYNPPLGFRAGEVIGKRSDELVAPEDAARLESLDRTVLRTGARVQDEVQVTLRGDVHHLLVSQEPLRDASGVIVGLAGAATDITEQKRAQAQLAQALAFREQMMGILGHDLRNPLGAVRALAALLLRRDDVPESARESIAEIGRAGQRMLEMIGTLLDFTSTRFTGLPIRPVPTDLHEVCRRVVGEVRAASPDRSVELTVEGEPRGTWDPARIAQVISNLVSNALQHGSAHAPVRVSIGGDDGTAVLSVENEGPPIPRELMPLLFEPFCRGSGLRDASHAGGLGLGLYIAKEVVDAHGGTIAVESTAERGTVFTVTLPRVLAAHESYRPRWDEGAAADA